jgi:hypothetical protein
MQITESAIQTEILNYLKKSGYFAWKNHTQGVRYSKGRGSNPNKGQPDLMAISQGLFYGIEVKKPGGSFSLDQYRWIEKLKEHGGIGIVTDSLEDCIKQIMTERRKNKQ